MGYAATLFDVYSKLTFLDAASSQMGYVAEVNFGEFLWVSSALTQARIFTEVPELARPTEATIGCTSRQITINDRKENIGRPFASCQAYVVDSAMNIVPRGTPGELVVEGPLVGVGYHKLPDATNRAFLEWPHPGCRCYRTGDLGTSYFIPVAFTL